MADKWQQKVMDAVRRHDDAQLQQLLQNSDQQTLEYWIEGDSPLTNAASCYIETCNIMEPLLLTGADVDFCDTWGETPLMIAARNGNIHLCKLLLKHGAKVNERNSRCWSALHYAAWCRNVEVVALLLDHGAQIYDQSEKMAFLSLKDKNKELWHLYKPLHHAVKYTETCMLKVFLDHSVKTNLRLPLGTLFNFSLHNRSIECAMMILQQGYYPTFDMTMEAIRFGSANLMRMLLEIKPHFCLQGHWLRRQAQTFPEGLAKDTDLISLLVQSRKQPTSLAHLCKSVILAQLEDYYLREGRIDELPLPKLLKTFLKKM